MSLSVDQLTKPLKVAKRVQETPDAISLVFEIPSNMQSEFAYQAGQFVTLFLDINGAPLNRSYSLCTSPLVDKEFRITVKKVKGGRGSTYLVDKVREGQTLRVTKPAGHFFKPSLTPTQYFLFAAGSGITPIYSILKTVLAANPENQVMLAYCNRNEQSIIFGGELPVMEEKHKGRLRVLHLLSQPSGNWPGEKGRCSTDWIAKVLRLKTSNLAQEYYLCGPDGYMETVRASLLSLGIDKSKLHEESFAIGLQPKAPELKSDWTYIGDKAQAKETSGGKLFADISGETVECEVKEDQSILEALLEAGANPPYSCMDGACMACMAKVQEGIVYQKDPGILSEENIGNHEALTCQARVLSRTVKVSYDDL